MELSISLSDIFVAALILISSGLGYIIKGQIEEIKSIKGQLSDKKYKLYNEIYSIFFDIVKADKGKKNYNSKDAVTRIIDIKKDLLIYAPDSIVSKYIEWNSYISNFEGDIKHVKIFFELYILMRKDMGHPKTIITENDILKLLMTTDSEVEKFKQLIEN